MPIRLAQVRLIQQDSVPTQLRKSPCRPHAFTRAAQATSHRIRSRWRAQTVSSGKYAETPAESEGNLRRPG